MPANHQFITHRTAHISMAAPSEGALLAVIADEDTVTGLLLAGVGNVDARKNTNFLIVDNSTHPSIPAFSG